MCVCACVCVYMHVCCWSLQPSVSWVNSLHYVGAYTHATSNAWCGYTCIQPQVHGAVHTCIQLHTHGAVYTCIQLHTHGAYNVMCYVHTTAYAWCIQHQEHGANNIKSMVQTTSHAYNLIRMGNYSICAWNFYNSCLHLPFLYGSLPYCLCIPMGK
jgi:hypothetical protein